MTNQAPVDLSMETDEEQPEEIDLTLFSSQESLHASENMEDKDTENVSKPGLSIAKVSLIRAESLSPVDNPHKYTIPGSSDLPAIALSVRRDPMTGLYTDGRYSAASLKMHLQPSTLPILDTPDDGVLHIISGWSPSEVLSDLCYRYNTWGKWDSKTCGFLGESYLLRKRGYKCNGVMACPVLLRSRDRFDHATEDDWITLQSLRSENTNRPDIMEMRKARNLYVVLTNPDTHFCNAKRRDYTPGSFGLGISAFKCQGQPVIRQVNATGEWFIGCTHFHVNPSSIPKHYFLSIQHFTPTARGYLQQMIVEKKPMEIPDDICQYVAVKKGRGTKRCSTHGVELVEHGTNNSEIGRCGAQLILMEQIGHQHESGENDADNNVTLAMCIGAHNHPPPPQADSTDKKRKAFRTFAEKAPQTTPASLRLQTQMEIHRGTSSAMGNLRLSKNMVYSTMNAVRKETKKDEFASIFEMLGTAGERYVRDVRSVTDGYVFLMATDDMLSHATKGLYFAGDATFKTVEEKHPFEVTPNWYLYNIVAPLDPTTPTHKGIVVSRGLMTVQSAQGYAAMWSMFFKAVKYQNADNLGIHRNDVSIDVPHMPVDPDRKNNAFEVRAVTIDFEAAEVQGITNALAEHKGGAPDLHMDHVMIGCRVHYDRAVLKRTRSLQDPECSQFKKACKLLRLAKTAEEADPYMAIIHSIDRTWGKWISESHVGPLISGAYSKMAPMYRMNALDNTNIVESQNRLGNLMCGTRLSPATCAQKFHDLDKTIFSPLCIPAALTKSQIPRVRTRKGHTLEPSGGKRSKKSKQQSGGKKKRKIKTEDEAKPRKGTDVKDKRSRDEMTERTHPNVSSSQLRNPAANSLQENLAWLHDDLSQRCYKAVQNGKKNLRIALSHLFSAVLEIENLNQVKLRILETMKNDGAEKEVFEEFSEILMLISKVQARNGKDIASDKAEDSDIEVRDGGEVISSASASAKDDVLNNLKNLPVVEID